MKIKKTICPLDCPDACGISANLDGNRITKIRADENHPFTQGYLCKKVSTYHERVQSDDRILFPQKRVGKKGEGKFQQISWDEAWEILTTKLQNIQNEYGGEALLPYSYAGNMGKISQMAGETFFYKFGASQLDRTICSSAAIAGWSRHYGAGLPATPPERVLDSEVIILWGINAKVSNVHFMSLVQKAKKNGAKVIVIDPYENVTATSADFHYKIALGGDTALALLLLKHLHTKGVLDQDFIKKYSSGYEEFKNYYLNLSEEELRDKAGLSEEAVLELVETISNNKKIFVRMGVGLTRNTQGAMSIRSITCLSAALGLFDGKEGKGALLFSSGFDIDNRALVDQSLYQDTRIINMVQLGRALTMKDKPIMGMIVYSSNPLAVAPDASMVREGLLREDLFTVVHEQFMTATARYADLLLPATTSFESSDVYTGYGHFYMGVTEPVVEPRGEAVSNFDFFQTLAQKMGYKEPFFSETIEDRIRRVLNKMDGFAPANDEIPYGTVFKSKRFDKGGDFTQFGKRKFHFTRKGGKEEKFGHPHLLELRELENVSLQKKYPLAIIAPPHMDLLNSTFGERYEHSTIGTVLIHPDDAGEYGVMNNSTVEIFNGRGKTYRTAVVTDKTQIGLLVAEGIYWENKESKNTGINDLASQEVTDLGGGGTFHESRCAVRMCV